MRLAMISYGLPVQGEKRGGIERAAHTIAQGLAERGHGVTVFSHDPKPERAAYDVRPLPWKRFVASWLGRRATMGYLGNLLSVLPSYRGFDAIIAHGDSLLLPLTGKPIMRIMQGSAWGEARHATSLGRFALQAGVYLQELLTAAITPGTVAISEATRRDNPFIRRVIHYGVDTRIFHPEPCGRSAEPSLLFVGTAGGRKRGAFLLDLFRRVIREAHPSARLMFVGPEGEPMAGVSYHCGIADDELGALYRRAWLYVSPSTYEGFGLPYLEAMASGTAVVASPNAGSIEVLDNGAYGRLAGDDGFGAAILELLRDADARAAMADAGLRRARELSLSRMLDAYEALLLELSHAHARSVAST